MAIVVVIVVIVFIVSIVIVVVIVGIIKSRNPQRLSFFNPEGDTVLRICTCTFSPSTKTTILPEI